MRCFNPRAHAGRDLVFDFLRIPNWLFQSTRPRGARPGATHLQRVLHQFQSTRPRGARHLACSASVPLTGFQSTRPRGARPGATHLQRVLHQFQSTRPRGARPRCMSIAGGIKTFQSTRPRGARRTAWDRASGNGRFNPRAHAGRDKSA